MRRLKNYLLLSKRQKYRRVKLRVNKDLLSWKENTLDNSSDINCNLAVEAGVNDNDCKDKNQAGCSNTQSQSFSNSDSSSSYFVAANVNVDDISMGTPDLESHRTSDSASSLNVLSGDDDVPVKSELKKNIRAWSLKYLIHHNAINSLLEILRSAGHEDLPKDARTLLCTPKMSYTQQISWGQYIHYGLEKALLDQFKTVAETKIPQQILLDVHVDGISISKSSKQQLWTIMGKIYNPYFGKPFFIGGQASYGKPKSVAEYLKNFCEEYSKLCNNGFIFKGKRYSLQIRAVIADSPARSFVTCTQMYNSFYGCGKCFARGVRVGSRTVFLERNCILRTDENFHQQIQIQHHLDTSPFEELGLKMVTQFPLDYMHMICLGVMKKLLKLWIEKQIIIQINLKILSDNLVALRDYVPREFARKSRSLDKLDRWKATEFRLFLYVGLALLKDMLPREYYIHFAALSCATMILCDQVQCIDNNNYADDLLKYFVEEMSTLYGDESVVYNVHNLIHIPADVKNFGPLDEFSAFPFESSFISLKKLLRKSDKPLAQLYNRISEQSRIAAPDVEQAEDYPLLQNAIIAQLPMNCHNAHRSIRFKNFTISCTNNDSCCLLSDGTILIVQHIGYRGHIPVIIGHKFNSINSIPDYPCDSTLLDIYMVRHLSKHLHVWPVLEIRKKVFFMPLSDGSNYVLPLVHIT